MVALTICSHISSSDREFFQSVPYILPNSIYIAHISRPVIEQQTDKGSREYDVFNVKMYRFIDVLLDDHHADRLW